MIDRPTLMCELVLEALRAGWKLESILGFATQAADLILGPSPAITPEVAAALDRALHETAAAPSSAAQASADAGALRTPSALATLSSATAEEARHDTVTDGRGGGAADRLQKGASPPLTEEAMTPEQIASAAVHHNWPVFDEAASV